MNTVSNNLGLKSYQISLSINRGQRAFNKLLKTCLGHNSLTVPKWSVLGQIYTNGELRPHEIAHEIGVKPPFATTVIQSLLEDGYLEAIVCPDDERGKKLALTEIGRKKVETVEKKLTVCIDEQLSSLEIQDLETFFSVSNYMALHVGHK